jgi:hypothetical protein
MSDDRNEVALIVLAGICSELFLRGVRRSDLKANTMRLYHRAVEIRERETADGTPIDFRLSLLKSPDIFLVRLCSSTSKQQVQPECKCVRDASNLRDQRRFTPPFA